MYSPYFKHTKKTFLFRPMSDFECRKMLVRADIFCTVCPMFQEILQACTSCIFVLIPGSLILRLNRLFIG